MQVQPKRLDVPPTLPAARKRNSAQPGVNLEPLPTVAGSPPDLAVSRSPRSSARRLSSFEIVGMQLAAIVLPLGCAQFFTYGSLRYDALLGWAIALGVPLRLVYSTRFLPLGVSNVFKSSVGVALGILALSLVNTQTAAQLTTRTILFTALAIVPLSVSAQSILARHRAAQSRVLIIGRLGGGRELADTIASADPQHFELVGLLDEVARSVASNDVTTFEQTVRDARPDIIVVAGVEDISLVVERVLDSTALSARVFGVPGFYEYAFSQVPLAHISSKWFMTALHPNQPSYARTTKRVFDLLVSVVAFALLLPVIVMITITIKLSNRGPVFFRQVRVGENGQLFRILKFRTMQTDAETDGARWAADDDPRVTSVGRLLRRTHLDETPQLWNIIRGEMSVVGPRPERPEFMRTLEAEVPFWSRRLLMKPGLTGWAQVQHGYTSDTDGTATKLSYDLWYLNHRSLILDAAILAMTLRVAVTGSGGR